MEIALLIAIIIILVAFQSNNKSRFESLYAKIKSLENTLNVAQFNNVKKEEPVVAPSVKEEPVIIVTEVKPIPVPIPEIKISEPEIKREEIIDLEYPQEPINKPPFKYEPAHIISETESEATEKTYTKKEREKSWFENFTENNPDLEKFIGENLISKIGIAILVLGIAYFVKFAIDQNWINEAARVGVGIFAGAIVMAFAHKLRLTFKAFSSVLVAGAIAIFYFTIGIAFHQYHLFSQTTAFAIMLAITAFSVLISISYNRMELAALSLIGGFATPFMVSTGEGNYVALFTYIMILNTGMLVLAYLRKWNLINIMTYVFTILLYGGWLSTKVFGVANPPYLGALIFGAMFYVTFVLMNIVNNIKEKRAFETIELSILISNTFLFYGAGMQILQVFYPEFKGIFTVVLALFNFVCSWLLYKNFKADKKLVYLLIGLTLTFVTLAAPVQLKGNYITLFWAAEAALLIWLSQRSKIIAFKFASIIVHVLMVFSLVMDWQQVYGYSTLFTNSILLNKGFITGSIAAISLFLVIQLLKSEKENSNYLGIEFNPEVYSAILKPLAVITLYFVGALELYYQTHQFIASDASANVIFGTYHLGYNSVILFLLYKSNKVTSLNTAFTLAGINILIYVIYFIQLPFTELTERLSLLQDYRLGFIFHYFSLAFIIYHFVVMTNCLKKSEALRFYFQQSFTWIMSVIIVYITSSELLLHVLPFTTDAISTKSPDSFYIAYANYMQARTQIVKIGFPILWGLIAFVFLAIGIKKQIKPLRIFSLALLAITVVKLFAYDINNVSEAGKIIAFIILGIVLLVMSFMYQKIKALILFDENADKNENKSNENN